MQLNAKLCMSALNYAWIKTAHWI